MKRFIVVVSALLAIVIAAASLALHMGAGPWLLFGSGDAGAAWRTEGRQILVSRDGQWEPFEMRGVNVSGAEPGDFVTDYATTKQTYLRWFERIGEMGANTLRVHMLMSPAFYEALREHNTSGTDRVLYLLQGVYLDDYAAYSHADGYDDSYLGQLRNNGHVAIDAVHGQRVVELGSVTGSGSYLTDVSEWVIGYAVGVPWDTRAVSYTNEIDADRSSYEGSYFSTAPGATPFEAMLASLVDDLVGYESQRYGEQRLMGIVNSPTTDPFVYDERIEQAFNKYETVDLEHIRATDELRSGLIAIYHVYPYGPDFGPYVEGDDAPFVPDEDGNAFRPYLAALVAHHSCPVVVGEFGVSSSRGVGYEGGTDDQSQGGMSEDEQARALAEAYGDIVSAGCAGSVVYEWGDEWARRTWNTVYSTDQLRTPFWVDAQTADQSYGLVSFDPGTEASVCYVDGDGGEWTDVDPVASGDGWELRVLYDERGIYLGLSGEAVGPDAPVAIPIDTTGKSGSTTAACLSADFSHSAILTYSDLAADAQSLAWDFSRAADFLVLIDGDEGCLYVQERSDASRAMMLRTVEGRDPYVAVPDADSPLFKPVRMARTTLSRLALDQPLPMTPAGQIDLTAMEDFEYDLSDAMWSTGVLREGNANPASASFDSLADYCYGDGLLEIRIPWQMLNFSDPSTMKVHDDYYEHYGVEDLSIDRLWVGVGVGDPSAGDASIEMSSVELEGWGSTVTYHERLKESYYVMQSLWDEGVSADALLAEGSPELAQARERAREAAAEQLATAGEAS